MNSLIVIYGEILSILMIAKMVFYTAYFSYTIVNIDHFL